MKNPCSFRFLGVLILTTVVLVFGMTPLGAQDSALRPVIVVLPFQNSTDNPSLSTVASTVSGTMELTLGLLGDYRVNDTPHGQIPTEVPSGDHEIIGNFSEQESIDYVVFGEIQEANGQIMIGASVYSRGEGRVTVSQNVTSDSVLDVFEATDRLTLEFLSEFSGQRIAFGELRLVREGWPSGEFSVSIDGTEAGRSVTSIDRVLIGPRFVEVRAENGPAEGDTIFSAPIYVEEGATVTVRFSMVAPTDSEAATAPRFEVERNLGAIRITVETTGAVYLDGEWIGELEAGQSATVRDVETGFREIEVHYADGERENSDVRVRKGAVAAAQFNYVERTGPGQYEIGDRGPAGGWVFYDKGRESNGWRYLEAAPRDFDERMNWDEAVSTARRYAAGGYSDWRLPTSGELNWMYENLQEEDIGGFVTLFYWSSSEGNFYNAAVQYFSNGFQTTESRNSNLRVRAVRAF